jgi:LEA14-like dessication related protein
MRAFVTAALATILAGCSHARPPPPAPLPVAPPLVALESAGVEGLGFTGANLAFRVRVENPNPTPLSIARVEYALDLEGRRAAQGSVPSAIGIVAATADGPGTCSVELPVQVRYAAVPGITHLLALEREAEYALGGSVVFLTAAGEVRVPMSASGRLIVPRAPKFRVDRVTLHSASALEVALEMKLEVSNPNAFDMPPGRVGCGLHLSGSEVVRADVVFPAGVGGGATATALVPIKLSPFKAGKAVARLLIPFSSLDASVKGEAVFGGVPVPLDLSTSILPR